MDLTAKLGPDGRLAWDVPAGNWTILRFGRTSTGPDHAPGPGPGLGLEMRQVRQGGDWTPHFDAFIGTLLRDGRPRPRHCGKRLDDAAHRQLGDEFAELDGRRSARSSAGAAATTRCAICRR